MAGMTRAVPVSTNSSCLARVDGVDGVDAYKTFLVYLPSGRRVAYHFYNDSTHGIH